MNSAKSGPAGMPVTRTVAMPADTNPSGDIFGGWIMSWMDVAGGIVASQRAAGRVATVAVEAMKFHLPVFVGDIVACHGEVVHIGRTSIGVRVEAWAERRLSGEQVLVTEGVYTFVALGDDRKPRPVPAAG